MSDDYDEFGNFVGQLPPEADDADDELEERDDEPDWEADGSLNIYPGRACLLNRVPVPCADVEAALALSTQGGELILRLR
jgi:hypothetical protein